MAAPLREPDRPPRRPRVPERNAALDLVRTTEAAAMAAGRWVGHGDRDAGDAAAATTMHRLTGALAMRGIVVVGEAEHGPARVLATGTVVGTGDGPECDVALDAVDGAAAMARGTPNALAVLATSERGAMYVPAGLHHVDKLAVGPECADVVDIDRPVAENLRAVAAAKKVRVPDVSVCVLDRPRNRALIDTIREVGARVHVLRGGDVAGAIATAWPDSRVDVLLGVGGAPAAILAAAALACTGGALQARPWAGDDAEHHRLLEAGHDPAVVLHTHDLVGGEDIHFCATGVTDGDLLRGVRFHPEGAATQSIVMRSRSGTVRVVDGEHRTAKLRSYFGADYAAVRRRAVSGWL